MGLITVKAHTCSRCGDQAYYQSLSSIPPDWEVRDGKKLCPGCIRGCPQGKAKYRKSLVDSCVNFRKTRGSAMRLIVAKPRNTFEVIEALGVGESTIRHTLSILREAGFIAARKGAAGLLTYCATEKGRKAFSAFKKKTKGRSAR